MPVRRRRHRYSSMAQSTGGCPVPTATDSYDSVVRATPSICLNLYRQDAHPHHADRHRFQHWSGSPLNPLEPTPAPQPVAFAAEMTATCFYDVTVSAISHFVDCTLYRT